MRKCIVTGEVKEKSQLLRFISAPDGQIVPDLYKKFSGKGVYVTNSYQSLEIAINKNLFTRALKKRAKVSADLLQTVENILHKKALDVISLAKKAGDVFIGLDKVLEALKEQKVAFVLEAKDAGGDGHKKMQHYIDNLPLYRLFGVEELDQTLGKVNTVYLAFSKTGMAKTVQDNFERLSAFLKDKNNGDEF